MYLEDLGQHVDTLRLELSELETYCNLKESADLEDIDQGYLQIAFNSLVAAERSLKLLLDRRSRWES